MGRGSSVGQYVFSVQVTTPLNDGEKVGLTGDGEALGNWQLDQSIALNCGDVRIWSAVVPALYEDSNADVQRAIRYRYFIYTESSKGHKQIKRWETHLKTRTVPYPLTSNGVSQIDHFGHIPSSNHKMCCNRGWITTENILQFKFILEDMFKNLSHLDNDRGTDTEIEEDASSCDLKLIPKRKIYIKLLAYKNDDSERNSKFSQRTQKLDKDRGSLSFEEKFDDITIEYSQMNYDKSALKLLENSDDGVWYSDGEILIFHVTASSSDYNYRFTFYDEERQLIGVTVIESKLLRDRSHGELQLNIVHPESLEINGELTLPYMRVKPYKGNFSPMDFSITYLHYWQLNWPNLHVGHRGNGRSFISNPPVEPENTIASFLSAYHSNMDMIELDVHLTADGIPVVYHDYGFQTPKKSVAESSTPITSEDQLEYVLIKDVNYEELKELRVFVIIDDKPHEYPSHNAESVREQRLFPTLMDVFEALPISLGIDVEIKWPQMRVDGQMEAEQTIDMNYFVDKILDTVIAGSAGRPLFFSSFDGDICTMLRFKQSIFPILFLTMGKSKKWPLLKDLRTRTFENALNNAQAFELMGTAPHAEDFIRDQGDQLMRKAHDLGQFVLVWGENCNSKQGINYFQEIGASAICYDRSDLYAPEDKEGPFFKTIEPLESFVTGERPTSDNDRSDSDCDGNDQPSSSTGIDHN